jgi:hypothetical protein
MFDQSVYEYAEHTLDYVYNPDHPLSGEFYGVHPDSDEPQWIMICKGKDTGGEVGYIDVSADVASVEFYGEPSALLRGACEEVARYHRQRMDSLK